MNIRALLYVPEWTMSLFLKAMSPQVRPASSTTAPERSGWNTRRAPGFRLGRRIV